MQFDNVYGFIKRFNPMLFWREHFLAINRCEMAFISQEIRISLKLSQEKMLYYRRNNL